MAKRNIYVDKDLNQQHLLNAQFEENTSAAFDGHEIRDNATERRHVQLNGNLKTYAWLSDLPQSPRVLAGTLDASAGALPTGTIEPGFEYVVTTDGTIAGIQGADELTSGDTLLFVGGSPNDPTDPSQWIGVQQNLNDAVLGNGTFETQTVDLAANTPLVVTATTIADIHNINTFDSSEEEIELRVQRTSATTITLESNVALTGVIVRMGGTV